MSAAVTVKRAIAWGALLVVLAVALYVGSRPANNETTLDRVHKVAATLKCPQCTDESMATSNAPTAVAGRKEIQRRLEAGESPDEIRAFFVSTYGKRLLLNPQRSGVDGLVWVIPVVATLVAVAALALVFARWRRMQPADALSDDERELVEDAVREREAQRDS